MLLKNNQLKEPLLIQTEIDGVIVTGKMFFLASRDYGIKLDADPSYSSGSHIPLLGAVPPYWFCTSDGEPTPQCIKSAQSTLKMLWQQHLFDTEHALEIEALKTEHAAQNAQRKAANEEVLKVSTRALHKQWQEGVITKEEHLAALKKRREAKDDLRRIDYELSDKISVLFKSYFPEKVYSR